MSTHNQQLRNYCTVEHGVLYTIMLWLAFVKNSLRLLVMC